MSNMQHFIGASTQKREGKYSIIFFFGKALSNFTVNNRHAELREKGKGLETIDLQVLTKVTKLAKLLK